MKMCALNGLNDSSFSASRALTWERQLNYSSEEKPSSYWLSVCVLLCARACVLVCSNEHLSVQIC